MRKMSKMLSVLLFLGFLGTSLLIAFRPFLIRSEQKQTILSPIPNFLSLLVNSQVSTLNLWVPLLSNIALSNLKKPEIGAKSALLYDLTTKEVLYVKNPKEKLPMASLTKIMTAVIALENKKADDKYIVKSEDLVGEDAMGLSQGEVLTLSDL